MQPVVLIGEQPSRLKAAAHIAGFLVRITWADGVAELKDLEPIILNQSSLAPLRVDSAVFRSVGVSDDGSRLTWPNGCSVSARAVSRLPHPEMSAADFRSLQADMHLNAEALGSLLGLSRRAITGYRAGTTIPRHVALAMKYLAARWEI